MTERHRFKDLLVQWHILPRDDRPHLGRFLLKNVPLVLVIAVLVLIAEKQKLLRGFETFALDGLLNLSSNEPKSEIFLIVIDDDDFETEFHGKSPLNPGVLNTVIQNIVRAQPAVLAIDLDTSTAEEVTGEWPPKAVWVRAAEPIFHDKGKSENSVRSLDSLHSEKALEEVKRGSFFWGKGKDEPAVDKHDLILTTPTSGSSLFHGDYDGVIRRYHPVIYSPESESHSELHGYIESFPAAICRAYSEYLETENKTKDPNYAAIYRRLQNELNMEGKERAEETFIRFDSQWQRYPRMSLKALNEAAKNDFWAKQSPLKNAIVVLGGTYSASRDVYMTPVGARYGVEIVAHTVETMLTHTPLREFPHARAFAIDVLVGIVMLVILWRFPGYRAFVMTLVAAGLLAVFASWVTLHSYAYWFNFAPMVIGLWLHFQWEKRKEQQELHHELNHLREELAKLKH